MRLRRVCAVLVALILIGSGSVLSVRAENSSSDLPQNQQGTVQEQHDLEQASHSFAPVTVIVQFANPSVAAKYPGRKGGHANVNEPEGQNYSGQLNSQQNQFESALHNVIPAAKVHYRYRTAFNGMALTLPGWDIPVLRRLQGVKSVSLNGTVRQLLNVSVPLINSPSAYASIAGGAGNAGTGIKIGIIDGGIDIRNPMFSDAGYPAATFPAVRCVTYTNNKVIVARGYRTSGPGVCADARSSDLGHGNHTAGTAAGDGGTTATVDGVSFTLGGVAPRALLGNYNVFPDCYVPPAPPPTGCFTGWSQIIAAINEAVTDGMQVLSMSIGGQASLAPDPVVDTVAGAVAAGVVVVIAAGNDGPADNTVSTPGVAPAAITVGASSNAHVIGERVSASAPTVGPSNLAAATGDFNKFDSTTTAFYVPWVTVFPTDDIACGSTYAGPNPAIQGRMVLIQRGVCTFTTKIRNAQTSGAVGVMIYNNDGDDPIAMRYDSTVPIPNQPTIPAVMLSNVDGVALRDYYTANGAPSQVRVDPPIADILTAPRNIIAGFSSRGPVLWPTATDYTIKPDVTAPGVNILSAAAMGDNFNRFIFMAGTSMATPHVSGAAALLRQLHPTWMVQDIKSALMNTALRPVRDTFTGVTPLGVMARGGGRIDLSVAKDPRATLNPASLSFGLFGPSLTPIVVTKQVTVKGVDALGLAPGGGTWTINVSVTRSDGTPAPAGDVVVTTSLPSVTVTNGGPLGSVTLTVTATISPTALGVYEGDIIFIGPTTLQLPFWVSAAGGGGGGGGGANGCQGECP